MPDPTPSPVNTLELTALDTVFFKDGKPFSMGEESWAQGVFPPYPSVMLGLLRSLWFADGHMADFPKANQKDDPTKAIHLTGYLPGLNNQAAFPIPMDLYREKPKVAPAPLEALRFRALEQPENLISTYEFPRILQPQTDNKIEELGGKAFLDQEAFQRYLGGEPGPFVYHKMDQFTSEEPKVGIGRNPHTRTASDGQLYRLAMRRLQGPTKPETAEEPRKPGGKFSFFLKAEGLPLPQKGITRIGAEAKAAAYQTVDFPKFECPVKPGATEFCLYLATPAIFREGPIPFKWLADHGLKVLACTNGRTAHIGGFDMVRRRPKCMLKAVPAGTVYYLGAPKGGITQKLINALHEGSIYNLAPEDDFFRTNYAAQGFGLSYLGNISSPKNHE